jgi:hypothetical protein
MIYLMFYGLIQSCVFIGISIKSSSRIGFVASFSSALYFLLVITSSIKVVSL